MVTRILRVTKCGDVSSVKSEKCEGGVLQKRSLVLQELGGKYEDSYAATALGSLATIEFTEGDLVAVCLRFQMHEHNGQFYQDVIATEINRI